MWDRACLPCLRERLIKTKPRPTFVCFVTSPFASIPRAIVPKSFFRVPSRVRRTLISHYAGTEVATLVAPAGSSPIFCVFGTGSITSGFEYYAWKACLLTRMQEIMILHPCFHTLTFSGLGNALGHISRSFTCTICCFLPYYIQVPFERLVCASV